MNQTLENILQTGYVKTADGQLIKIHSGISREEGKFLQSLISEVKPTITLEIGLAHGISALFICDELAKIPNARHIIVDPAQFSDKYWKGAGIESLRSAGYNEMIEFYELPAHIALPRLESEGRRVDFAFIDGAHLFDYALVDFFCVDRLLRVGGIVAFDDLWMPSLQRLCRYIITSRSYTVFRYFPNNPRKGNKPSLKRRLLQEVAKSSQTMRRVIRFEYAQPKIDLELGLPNQCIAFRKEAEDQRSWDSYYDF